MMIPVRHFAGLRCLLYRLFIARVVIDMELPLMVKRNFTLPTWCDIDLVRVEIDLRIHQGWSLHNWRRTPSGPTAALLTLAAKAPEVVLKTLRAW